MATCSPGAIAAPTPSRIVCPPARTPTSSQTMPAAGAGDDDADAAACGPASSTSSGAPSGSSRRSATLRCEGYWVAIARISMCPRLRTLSAQ